MSKTCSPGSFPEGKVRDSGRIPGRSFLNIMFSVPEIVPLAGAIFTKIIAQLPGREPEGYPEGKMGKVMLEEQWPREPDFEGESGMMFRQVSRTSWPGVWPSLLAPPGQPRLAHLIKTVFPWLLSWSLFLKRARQFSKTPIPGRFPEGKVGDSGRIPGRLFFTIQ